VTKPINEAMLSRRKKLTNAFGRSYIPIVWKIVFLATQVSGEIAVYDPPKTF
jgi:hypothetical protein